MVDFINNIEIDIIILCAGNYYYELVVLDVLLVVPYNHFVVPELQ
jgi:hypothetical protein